MASRVPNIGLAPVRSFSARAFSRRSAGETGGPAPNSGLPDRTSASATAHFPPLVLPIVLSPLPVSRLSRPILPILTRIGPTCHSNRRAAPPGAAGHSLRSRPAEQARLARCASLDRDELDRVGDDVALRVVVAHLDPAAAAGREDERPQQHAAVAAPRHALVDAERRLGRLVLHHDQGVAGPVRRRRVEDADLVAALARDLRREAGAQLALAG